MREQVERTVLSVMIQSGLGGSESLFRLPKHKRVAAAISRLESRGDPIDAISVAYEGRLSVPEMVELEDYCPTAANRDHHIGCLEALNRREQIVSTVRRVAKASDSLSEEEIETEVLKAFEESQGPSERVVLLKEAIKDKIKELENPLPEGYKTGITALDAMIRPARGKQMVIAARPGMGKTAFALQFADNLSAHGIPVLVWSLEMTAVECAGRQIARASNVPVSSIDRRQLQSTDWSKMARGIGSIQENPMYYVPGHINGLEAFTRVARRAIRERGVQVCIVDYLQLIEASAVSKRANENDRVAYISRQLKILALSHNCLVVLLSQLNRQVDDTPDKIPKLHHLRSSGAIEQDADIALFLMNPSKYNPDEQDDKCLAFVAKNRQGRDDGRRPITMRWFGAYNKFLDWS